MVDVGALQGVDLAIAVLIGRGAGVDHLGVVRDAVAIGIRSRGVSIQGELDLVDQAIAVIVGGRVEAGRGVAQVRDALTGGRTQLPIGTGFLFLSAGRERGAKRGAKRQGKEAPR